MGKINFIVSKIKNDARTPLPQDIQWKEFKLGEIFEIEDMSGKDSSNFNEYGCIPLVIAKKDNNGVGLYIKNGKRLFNGNKITLIKTGDGGAGLSFYQKNDFYATSSVMILKENNKYLHWKLNENIGLFCTVMMKHYKKIFSHSNSINIQKFSTLTIMLPAKNNEPNWEYMDNFIENIKINMHISERERERERIKLIVEKIKNYKQTILQYNVKWKEFIIGNIFDVKSTKTRELKKYTDGTIPFVSGTSINNGVEKFVSTNENLENGNCITVSSLDCSAFYQKKDFVGRGHGVVQRLYNTNLNRNISLFICTIIKKLGTKYNYSNQCFLNTLKNEIILLPAKDNQPDWKYMDNFINDVFNVLQLNNNI